MTTNISPLDGRIKQLTDAEAIVNSERTIIAEEVEKGITNKGEILFIDSLKKHLLFLQDQNGYYFGGKVLIPIDVTKKPYLLDSNSILKTRIEKREKQISSCTIHKKPLKRTEELAKFIESLLLSRQVFIHHHSDKEKGLLLGISFPKKGDACFLNLKSKQNNLHENGGFKKVRLSVKIPYNTSKKAEFVVHKVMIKTKESDRELELQQLLDPVPKLIHAVVEYPKKGKSEINTSIYETYYDQTLTSLKSTSLSDEKQLHIVLQIVKQVYENFHKKGFLHSDLKRGNILVNSNFDVRIIDYGLTMETTSGNPLGRFDEGLYGSVLNTPPEIFGRSWKHQKNFIDPFKMETFALGVILWAWLRKYPHWSSIPLEASKKNLQITEEEFLFYHKIIKEENERHEIKNDLEGIVHKLMKVFPSERMSLEDAIKALEQIKTKYSE